MLITWALFNDHCPTAPSPNLFFFLIFFLPTFFENFFIFQELIREYDSGSMTFPLHVSLNIVNF